MSDKCMKYQVLRDTGEKENKGWWFDPSDRCAGTVERNLFTADYSLIVGEADYYEQKLFVVERKGSVTELVANITQKEKWADFKDELTRLEEFRHSFVVCEFSRSLLATYPQGSGIPRHLWSQIRIQPQFLMKRMLEIELAFKTKWIFCDGPGRALASSLFKRVVENVIVAAHSVYT